MTLSEYELLREANIAENQRTLDALGLVTSKKNMGSHLIPIISAPPREPRPYVKHVRFVDEDRVASLRKRVTHDIPRPNFYRDKRAMTRSRAREEASRVVIKKPRQPRASIGEGRVGGGAGGWNAGPYVGTAMMVQGRTRPVRAASPFGSAQTAGCTATLDARRSPSATARCRSRARSRA